MGRIVRVFALLVVLWGCGGGLPDSAPTGFVNQTQHTDAELWVIWQQAQHSVAHSVDMNPLQRSETGATAVTLPGDSRALQIMPHQLKITGEPDVPSSALLAATGDLRPDPTGLIACPQPCNVRYAAAYSVYRSPVTKYAASWEPQESNFSFILEYEFENQILYALGYDMRWR